jgi:hypothetical protein
VSGNFRGGLARTYQPKSWLPAAPYWKRRGLRAFVVPGLTRGCVFGNAISLSSGTAAPTFGLHGKQFVFADGSTPSHYASFTDPALFQPSKFTIFALAQSNANLTQAQVIVAGQYDGTTVPLGLGIYGGGSSIIGASYYDGAGWRTSGVGATLWAGDGIWHVFGGRYDSSVPSLSFWVDGVNQASATPGGTGLSHSNTMAIIVGGYLGGSTGWQGNIAAVAIFNTALTDLEMYQLSRSFDSIWQLSRAPYRRPAVALISAGVTGLLNIGASSGGSGWMTAEVGAAGAAG